MQEQCDLREGGRCMQEQCDPTKGAVKREHTDVVQGKL